MHKLKPNYITLGPKNRLYNCEIPIIGLTGGIATGKSTASELLRKNSLEIIDADKLVKDIYQEPQTVQFISEIDQKCVNRNAIDFKMLRELFFSNQAVREQIEQFIYNKLPQFFEKESQIIIKNKKANFIIYDVPLLFEKGLEKLIDFNLLVYSPVEIQIKRLLTRDKITKELALSIISNQLPIDQKKQLSSYLIENTSTKEHLDLEIQRLMKLILK